MTNTPHNKKCFTYIKKRMLLTIKTRKITTRFYSNKQTTKQKSQHIQI